MKPEKTYEEQLNETLEAARKRLRQGEELKALEAAAPSLYEIIDGEISLAVNRMTQDKPLDYESYLSAHGEVKGIKRIRNLMTSKVVEAPQAAAEVAAIEGNLNQIKNDKKQSQPK